MAMLFAATIFALCTLITGGQDTPKKPHTIEGSWLAVAGSRDGKKIPDGDFAKLQLTVTLSDGKYKITIKDKDKDREIETVAYKLDESKKPARIDLTINKSRTETRTQLGIFKLDGDTLTVSIAAVGSKFRPEGFEDDGGIEVTKLVRTK